MKSHHEIMLTVTILLCVQSEKLSSVIHLYHIGPRPSDVLISIWRGGMALEVKRPAENFGFLDKNGNIYLIPFVLSFHFSYKWHYKQQMI